MSRLQKVLCVAAFALPCFAASAGEPDRPMRALSGVRDDAYNEFFTVPRIEGQAAAPAVSFELDVGGDYAPKAGDVGANGVLEASFLRGTPFFAATGHQTMVLGFSGIGSALQQSTTRAGAGEVYGAYVFDRDLQLGARVATLETAVYGVFDYGTDASGLVKAKMKLRAAPFAFAVSGGPTFGKVGTGAFVTAAPGLQIPVPVSKLSVTAGLAFTWTKPPVADAFFTAGAQVSGEYALGGKRGQVLIANVAAKAPTADWPSWGMSATLGYGFDVL